MACWLQQKNSEGTSKRQCHHMTSGRNHKICNSESLGEKREMMSFAEGLGFKVPWAPNGHL